MSLDAQLDFLDFVSARHNAWKARQAGVPQPWTDDPIVNTRKFTNVFRVLDYGSQFVLTDLLDPELDPQDQLMRLFLYRHTGRVEVWQYLQVALGEYPTRANLWDVFEAWQEYRGVGVTKLQNRRSSSERIGNAGGFSHTIYERPMFTNAYLVFPQSQVPGTDKLRSIVELTERLFVDGSVGEDFLRARTQADRFAVLRSQKGVADFMSMQILTDWGYGTDFREDEFVIAGPGARKGAAALGMPAEEAIRWAVKSIRGMEQPPLLDSRYPSYMDAQNCLCEFSKYVRYQQKPTPPALYTPAHPGPLPYALPERW